MCKWEKNEIIAIVADGPLPAVSNTLTARIFNILCPHLPASGEEVRKQSGGSSSEHGAGASSYRKSTVEKIVGTACILVLSCID
jgi:hypothetical protein